VFQEGLESPELTQGEPFPMAVEEPSRWGRRMVAGAF
jgi:hypothetical protein